MKNNKYLFKNDVLKLGKIPLFKEKTEKFEKRKSVTTLLKCLKN